MTEAFAQQPAQPPPTQVTVAEVMRPPVTTADLNDHAAAAAYLMKHADATALLVIDIETGHPKGIITEKDIAHAVADGKDLNQVRIYELMTERPTVIAPATSVRDAAEIMMRGHFRHLPLSCGSRAPRPGSPWRRSCTPAPPGQPPAPAATPPPPGPSHSSPRGARPERVRHGTARRVPGEGTAMTRRTAGYLCDLGGGRRVER